MTRFDVIGLGLATMDILVQTPRLPASNDCFPVERIEMQGGGPAATALAAIARLGASASYLGPFAPDETGKQIETELKSYGIDTSSTVRRSEGISSTSVILVERKGGNRSILFQKGTSLDLQPGEVPASLLQSARALHLDGFFSPAALYAAKIAKDSGLLVSFDGGAGEIFLDNLDDLLSLVDVLVVARQFASRISGQDDPLQSGPILYEKYKPQQVVITDGEAGCWYWDGSSHLHQPAYPVQVVDTTGAGDTFHGAYLFACLQAEWIPAFRLKFASAVAALKCTRLGGRKGIPTLSQTLTFLAAQGEQLD